jgi:hypothetical protein
VHNYVATRMQVQECLASMPETKMVGAVLEQFGPILNAFHSACILTSTREQGAGIKDMSQVTREVKYIHNFYTEFLTLAGPAGVV